jgi:hypothetical protein
MSLCVVEPNVLRYLTITNWAKFQRIHVIFIDMVETVHKTAVVYAMGNSEHMPNLMNHSSHRRVQYLLPIDFILFASCEFIIPSEEREDADPSLVFSPSIDIIPIIPRIDILQSDPHNTVGILRNSFFHIG